MKFILFIILFIPSVAFADVYVMHKGDEIVGLSQQNDMVLEPGAEITILNGTLEDLSLSRPLDEYKFSSKKFKVNAQAVKAKDDAQLDVETKVNAKKAKRKAAKDKLKALGLSDDDVDALFEKD